MVNVLLYFPLVLGNYQANCHPVSGHRRNNTLCFHLRLHTAKDFAYDHQTLHPRGGLVFYDGCIVYFRLPKPYRWANMVRIFIANIG